MHAHHTVVDFPETPQPLPRGGDGVVTTLARSRFIHTADPLIVGVLAHDDPLALVSYACFIPLD